MAKFVGTSGDDTIIRAGDAEGAEIIGNAGNDFLEGTSHDDVILGGKGSDLLRGQQGNDLLFGGQGDDTINGGQGDDTMNGDKGNDILRVGGGSDTIVFTIKGQAGNEDFYDGWDLIQSYTAGDDKIVLSGANADYNDISFVQNGNDLDVYYDTTLMARIEGETFTGNASDYVDFPVF